MAPEATLGTERAVRSSNLGLIVHEEVTLPRAQLGKRRTFGTRERLFTRRHVRTRPLEEATVVIGGNCFGDRGRVDFFDNVFVACRVDGAIDEEGADRVDMFRAERLLHRTRTRWRRHDGVRGMSWPQRAGQRLTREQREVPIEREDLRFHMKFV